MVCGSTAAAQKSSARPQANGDSVRPSISADGRLIAFDSLATNLSPHDTNRVTDVFVYDRVSDKMARVSVDSSGREGNAGSWFAQISGNGNYVAFMSEATNLVPDDTNGVSDVFVHDRNTSRTTRISVSSNGKQGNGATRQCAISMDGRYVTFVSTATNFVAGDTNDSADVFLHDRKTNKTTRVSVDSTGAQGDAGSGAPSISGDGTLIVFLSHATNLVSKDTNRQPDVFVYHTGTGKTIRVSVNSQGAQADGYSDNPTISADGRYVAFESWAENLVDGPRNGHPDVFLHNLIKHTTEQISARTGNVVGNGQSRFAGLSATGRYAIFESWTSNLIPRKSDIYTDLIVKDLQTGKMTRCGVDSSGTHANHDSGQASLSGDGSLVVFASKASNLVPEDTNHKVDVFLHKRSTRQTSRVSLGSPKATSKRAPQKSKSSKPPKG